MTLQADQILAALNDHVLTLNVCDTVSGHETKAPPGTGVHCEMFGGGFECVPARSGLGVVAVKLLWRMRLRTSWMQKPADDIDHRLLKVLDPIMTSFIGGFTLGGTVVAFDVLGAAGGSPVTGQFGYLDQGGQMFRTVEAQLPLIVDDLWTEAA